MSLYNGIDPTAVITEGVYSETYGSVSPGTIANLVVSRGLLENAPNITISIINIVMSFFRRRNG